MKKNYSKPEIVFESFKLTSSIANTCSGDKGNQATADFCTYTEIENGWELGTIFSESNTGCGQPNCYHVPADTSGIFGS